MILTRYSESIWPHDPIIDLARLHCDIAAEKQPQVLRLRYAPLRMTDFLVAILSGRINK
jgi:hypothetical protein